MSDRPDSWYVLLFSAEDLETPGAMMDAFIAIRLFGIPVDHYVRHEMALHFEDSDGSWVHVPRYSRNVLAAGLILDHFHDRLKLPVNLLSSVSLESEIVGWSCGLGGVWASNADKALAISHAAVRAIKKMDKVGWKEEWLEALKPKPLGGSVATATLTAV